MPPRSYSSNAFNGEASTILIGRHHIPVHRQSQDDFIGGPIVIDVQQYGIDETSSSRTEVNWVLGEVHRYRVQVQRTNQSGAGYSDQPFVGDQSVFARVEHPVVNASVG